MQKRRNDVKARTTLLLALPDEHQLRFSKYKTAQELWAAILKTFGGKEATKKTKKNLLKQQYGNFKAEGSKTLEQTFNRLQAIFSHLEFMDIEIEQDDLNQKFLTSLDPEWLMHMIVWRNRSNLDTMSLDDLYNHLKVYEPEVQKKSESNSQNMAFISSAKNSSGNEEVNTASIPTASTQVSPAGPNVATASISLDTACAYMASQSNGSQIKYEEINQIDEDDIEEMDIKWSALTATSWATLLECAGLPAVKTGEGEITTDKEENHALVADEEAPTKFALMAKSSSDDEEGLGCSVVPPPPAQVYSPPKKDMSWTGLPEFADDTITDYSRPSPAIESNSDDLQNKNPSVTKTGASSSTILSKHAIKFVKAAERPTKIKTNKVETIKEHAIKYAEMYRKTSKSSNGNSQINIDDKGYWDSGCSRHMTGNISYLSDYKPFDGGYVSFGGCKITGKGTIKTGKLEFENVYFVKDLKTPRQHNLYSIDLNNVVPHKDLTCLVAKASADECVLWHRRLGHLNIKTMNRNFITEIENLKGVKVKIIRCDNGGEFRNKEMNDFCSRKGIKREFNNARTPQQNGIVERRNRTLIEAAKTMVLVIKSQNKTPYELFNGRTHAIGFLKPFGCHVMILNTLDHLGKFDAKGDEGTKEAAGQDVKKYVSLLRYIALPSWFHEAHLESSISNAQDACNADAPESSRNSNPTATSTNPLADHMETLAVETPIPTVSSPVLTACLNDSPKLLSDTRLISKRVTSQDDTPSLDNILTLTNRFEDILGVTTNTDESNGVEADLGNMEYNISASPTPTPTFIIHKDHPKSQIIGPVDTPVQTRTKSKEMEEQSFIAIIHQKTDTALLQFYLFSFYQMDVKSAFFYGTIDEEVYVMQPPGFQDLEFPARVYKVEKAISANTPIDKENPWGKDGTGKDVDLHLYRSMIGSLMYLTASRPDIMFAVCACARHQVTPKECHLHAVKRIFRYLKGHLKLGLWYPKESPFDLVAYSDSDYGGATQDRKSTTGGCQFLGRRLISWQYKNQTIVATSTTEAEYVAASSGCGQVLHHFIRDCFEKKLIRVDHIHTDDNATDLLTKPFDARRFQYLVIVDFVEASHLRCALTINPTVYVSHIRQFWSAARIETTDEGTKILATVDGKPRTIFESSIGRNLKLKDEAGISSLPEAELFENLTLMGYNILPDQKFSFQKGQFSNQWKYLIHTIMQCLSPKSNGFNEFSSNIATALVCLATNRVYNFSKMIFDGMVQNVNNKVLKFLTYPRNICTTLRVNSPSFSGRTVPLFPSMLVTIEAEQDRANITKTSTLPSDSTPRVTSLAADEGSMQHKLTELTDLCTRLQRQQDEMASKITAQDLKISALKARIKHLEDKDKGDNDLSREGATIKGRRLEIREEPGIVRSTDNGSNDTEEMINVLTSLDAASILTSGVQVSVPPTAEVPTVSIPPVGQVPTGSGVVPTASLIFTIAVVATPYSRRKDDRANQRAVKYQDHLASILKYKAQQSKPISKKQQREFYMSVLRSHAGWKTKHFKGMPLEEIREKFDLVWKQIQDFIPMGSKEEGERFKRKGLRLEHESAKKVKTSEEVSEEDLMEMMQLVPVEEVYIEALQVKHPIIDWEIHTEGERSYWKIIRLGGSSASYPFFVDILKHFDREDLNQLWALVKETLSIKPATSDNEKELWVELKRLYEPDVEDQLWTYIQALIHDPVEWRLYDFCGVHHVLSGDQEIFMLVEKDYPLRKGIAIVMISNKLQVQNYSQMANDLILKIHQIANSPRQRGD
nr:uncharacterized mitochondrial protein AtMg00810-like [Tanacetum cinerariifolium]